MSSYTAVGVTDLILSVWSSSADGLSEERNTFYLTLFLGLAGVQILVMLSTSITVEHQLDPRLQEHPPPHHLAVDPRAALVV